jgi:protein-arginine kinase activator protein McsA
MNKEIEKKSNKRKVDKLITDYFKPILKEQKNTEYSNKCLECGVEMGDSARQLCGKWRCYETF